MALDILYTEETTGEVRVHRRKKEADGQLQIGPAAALVTQEALHMLSEEAPVNLLPHFFPKSMTGGAMSYGSEVCQFLTPELAPYSQF